MPFVMFSRQGLEVVFHFREEARRCERGPPATRQSCKGRGRRRLPTIQPERELDAFCQFPAKPRVNRVVAWVPSVLSIVYQAEALIDASWSVELGKFTSPT